MNKIYLFALFVAVAAANLAADLSGLALSRQTLSCLSGQNVTKVILEISDEQGVTNRDFLNGYIYSKDAGIATVDALVIVNDNFTSNWLSTTITSALPASFNGTVWLQVLDSPKLWNQTISRRIAYLETLVLAFKQNGFKVGTYSNANTWQSVFGSQSAGSDTLKLASVWYANDNGNQNFDDFSYAGFGTWTKPALKNYQNSVYTCYTNVVSFNYYEAEAQFKKIQY